MKQILMAGFSGILVTGKIWKMMKDKLIDGKKL